MHGLRQEQYSHTITYLEEIWKTKINHEIIYCQFYIFIFYEVVFLEFYSCLESFSHIQGDVSVKCYLVLLQFLNTLF